MCGIFASRNKDKFYELAKLNSYRGSHSHSISYYNGSKVSIVTKGLGPMPEIDLDEDYLIIGHVQEPTTERSENENIHPAYKGGDYLWHNGIILDTQVKKWQEEHQFQKVTWDTYILLTCLLNGDPCERLSNSEGSFACIWYGKFNPFLSCFRNDNSPLFYDKEGNLSSTKFENSLSLDSGKFYSYVDNKWKSTDMRFDTKDNFYWSPE